MASRFRVLSKNAGMLSSSVILGTAGALVGAGSIYAISDARLTHDETLNVIKEEAHAELDPLVEKTQAKMSRLQKEAKGDMDRMVKEAQGWSTQIREEHEKMRDFVRKQMTQSRMDMVEKSDLLREVKGLQARIAKLEKQA